MTQPPPETPRGRAGGRSIPPLVWIIVAALLAWFIAATLQKGATDRTPHGGAAPEARQGRAVVPPAPAGPGAPATPGGVVGGPGGANAGQ